ncbi:Uncharacterized protein YtfP [Vitis vinifera]|uniref:Uncharacterized protein YtfP n=1 Tax=Vitis vinifera TaxID=29760 RepID=A0A438JIC0_VITVI|nr:Uncharacterized protein YtfP [Vitis vinifera]
MKSTNGISPRNDNRKLYCPHPHQIPPVNDLPVHERSGAAYPNSRGFMGFTLVRFIHTSISRNHGFPIMSPKKKLFTTAATSTSQKSSEERLVVVGGGAAGVYGAIRAKTVAPNLDVVIIEKGKPLSKVKISGGGRCNVTNGHCLDKMILAEHYPRGNKEFRGSFFSMHGPVDTMSWFSDNGVNLKTEDDGRVFPVSNSSSSVIECLMSEMKKRRAPQCPIKPPFARSWVSKFYTGKVVTTVSTTVGGKFLLKIEKRTINSVEYLEADYLLIASGSSRQGYTLATQLGHSIIDPVPSLFTFKIEDPAFGRIIWGWTHVSHSLGIQWASNSSIICLGARDSIQFRIWMQGILLVDFTPDLHIEDVKTILIQHQGPLAGLDGNILWASISNNSLYSVASLLKHCSFGVTGKGIFKDEFVTAVVVPLSESGFLALIKISLNTMGEQDTVASILCWRGNVPPVICSGFSFFFLDEKA